MDQNRRFRKYVDEQASHRIALEKAGEVLPDIFKLLLDYKDKNTGESMQFKELSDEAVVLILAGKFDLFLFCRCSLGYRDHDKLTITSQLATPLEPPSPVFSSILPDIQNATPS